MSLSILRCVDGSGTARSYLPPVQIGEIMRAAGLGEVVQVGSAVTRVKVGDFVQATTGQSLVPVPVPVPDPSFSMLVRLGWTEYAVLDESGLTPLR
jgi:NADPH:quinone reductase-like Zn-dependent oxidoreductase